MHNLGDVKRRVHRYSTTAAPPAIGVAVTAAGGDAVRRSRTERADTGRLASCSPSSITRPPMAPLAIAGATLRELPLPFAVPRR